MKPDCLSLFFMVGLSYSMGCELDLESELCFDPHGSITQKMQHPDLIG